MNIGTTWYINIKGIITESNWTVNNFFRWANLDNNYSKRNSENKTKNVRSSNKSKVKKK